MSECEVFHSCVIWFHNNETHRTDIDPISGLTLPAMTICKNSKYWYQHGKRYRTDIDPISRLTLPAYEGCNGDKEWYQNDVKHRIEQNSQGEFLPAIERSNGDKEWWISGKKLSQKEFICKVQSLAYILKNYKWNKVSKLSKYENFYIWYFNPNNIGGKKAIQDLQFWFQCKN